MTYIGSILLILSLFIHFICQRALGRLVVRFIAGESTIRQVGGATHCLFGLLVYLLIVLALRSLGLSWPLTVFAPYILLLGRGGRAALFLSPSRNILEWKPNHALWFITHVIFGSSLFDIFKHSIFTPWKNSYGDLPFHLHMISGFALGDNFPPEQLMFAGAPLSYPFFINLWSAALWFWEPTLFLLSIIFIFQWVVLWEVVFESLNGDENPFLPWMVLLGGGVFWQLGKNSGELIGQGFGVTAFLPTVLVPQRAALFGIATGLLALSLYLRWERDPKEKGLLFLCGLLLGMAPLVHTHINMTVGIFVILSYLSRIFFDKNIRLPLKERTIPFLSFLAISVHALPFLMSKQSLISLEGVGLFSKSVAQQSTFPLLVIQNFLPWIILWVAVWICTRAHRHMVIFSLLVLVAWHIRLSIWEWDQIKVFLALYLVLLSLLRKVPSWQKTLSFLLLPILTVPSVYELSKMFQEGPRHEIYNQEKVLLARELNLLLPKTAILAAAPDHNSVATLTGRRLFVGYDGWLWSHGISYRSRRDALNDLPRILSCRGEVCPTHLVWSEAEKRFWKQASPPKDARLKMVIPSLYAIIPESK